MTDEPDEIIEMLLLDNDEEWEAMLQNMTHEQRLAYALRMYEALSADPEKYPGPPAEMLAEMKEGADKYAAACEAADLAEQKLRIAVARRDSLAEAMLLNNPEPKSKGH